MQSPLQPLHGLRSTLDLQHHRPGGCLCILYRALLLGLRLRLGLVLFLLVVFLDLGLLLLLGRLRFLWHRSLLDVLLLGELSLTRLAGAGLCILVVLDHFDARHRDDHLGIALQAQVTLLHLLHGDRLEGQTIGGREFAASLGLEGLCLVGGAEITLGCDLSPLLFLSAGAQFLHQQKVLGLGPLVVVDKDLLIKGPTKTKHTRTTKRKSMNLRNLKMLLYPRHSKLTTHRHVIVSLSLGLRLVSPSVVDSQLKLRLPAAQLLLSRDIPKLVSESLQFLSSS